MRFLSTRTRTLIAAVMLAAFAVRALIPLGFMPVSASPLTLEICPDGLPAALLGHAGHHHHGNGADHNQHGHGDHCLFGGAGAAPLAASAALGTVLLAQAAPAARTAAGALLVRLVHLPEARGPPNA